MVLIKLAIRLVDAVYVPHCRGAGLSLAAAQASAGTPSPGPPAMGKPICLGTASLRHHDRILSLAVSADVRSRPPPVGM